MKRNFKFALITLLAVILWIAATGRALAWVNGGFETGTLAGWNTLFMVNTPNAAVPGNATGIPGGAPARGASTPYADVVPGPQIAGAIVPAQANPAWGSGGALTLPFAGNFSGQIYSGNGSPHGYGAWLYQSDSVPLTTCCLVADIAAVLEGDHFESCNPNNSDAYVYLQVTLGGVAGPIIYSIRYSWSNNLSLLMPAGLVGNGCNVGNYSGNYSCPQDCPGAPTNAGPWKYLPWTPQVLNLCPYVGQTVTLSYYAVSCYQQEHYAFGYLDNVNWDACPAAITLVKSVNPAGQVPQGTTLTYTINYTNPSLNMPMNYVTICDTIPAGVVMDTTQTAQTAEGSSPDWPYTYSGTQPGDSICWAIDSIPAGASGSVSFTAVVQNLGRGVCDEIIPNTAYQFNDETNSSTSNTVTNTVQICSPTDTPTTTRTITPSKTVTLTITPSITVTDTPTITVTMTPTVTVTITPSVTVSDTPTITVTKTPTVTVSDTPTITVTKTPTVTVTITPSITVTQTRTVTVTITPTVTVTITPSITVTRTPTMTPTMTNSPTWTADVTRTDTLTSTDSPTSTDTLTDTVTGTRTDTPTDTPTFTVSPTITVSPTSAIPSFLVSITIYNSAGEVVKTLVVNTTVWGSTSGISAPPGGLILGAASTIVFSLNGTLFTAAWDGKNDNGQIVALGDYQVLATVANPFGGVPTIYSTTIVVLSAPTSTVVNIFNSAGEKVWWASPVGVSGADFGMASDLVVIAADGHNQNSVKLTLNGATPVIWNGNNMLGRPVTSGTYMIQVVNQVKGGPIEISTKTVVVVRLKDADPLTSAVVFPNPAPSSSALNIAMAVPTQGVLIVRLYTLNGELAGNWTPAPAPEMTLWPNRTLASGIYLISLELDVPSAAPQRRIVKWAIAP